MPRNNEIKAAGDIDRMADPHGVRERFDEDRWVRWNHVRAFASTAAFGLLAWALVESGQTLRQMGQSLPPQPRLRYLPQPPTD